MGAKVAVASQSYDDPDVATHVADANYDELVKSLDPLSFALKLVSRGLVLPRQARDILCRAKTVSDRNSALLNLIKSSPDLTWFAALLEALGEERTTERLKEALKKSYVDWEGRHGLRRVPHTATSAASDQKSRSSSSQPPASQSRQSVADAAAFQEPPSYSDTCPMEEWNRAALVSLQGDLKINVIMKNGLNNKLQKAAGGFMSREEALAVESKPSNAEQMGELIRILLGKGNVDFRTFCTMLHQSNYSVWADELERKAREFRRETATMCLWKKQALKSMRQDLGRVEMNVVMIKKLEKPDIPSPDNIGFLSHEQLQEVQSKTTPTEQMSKVIDILLEMEDKYFENFCKILEQNNFELQANKLRKRAEEEYERYVDCKAVVTVHPAYNVETLEEGDYKYLRKAIQNARKNKKANPHMVMKTLYHHTYHRVVNITANYGAQRFRDIMVVARTAIRLRLAKGDIMALDKANTVADVLDVLHDDKDWKDTGLLEEIVNYLPGDARAVAVSLLDRYNSYLKVFEEELPVQDLPTSDVAVPEGTRARVEITVDKKITEYTSKDCIVMLHMLLHICWQCPHDEDIVDVNSGSITVVFLIDKAFTENIIQYSLTSNSLWAFQELRVTRIRVGAFELNVVQLLTQHFKEALYSGLTGVMDFVGATKALPYQVYALVDPDIAERLVKRTVYRKIAQSYSEQEELVSGAADSEGVGTTPEMHEHNFPPKVEEEAELDDEGKIKEATDSGELLSHVQELEDELKNSEWKRMDLAQKNMALMNHLKVCQEQKDHTEQEMASLKDRLVSMLISQGGADRDSALTAPSDVHSKRIPHRWWLKVSSGSYDASLLPSFPMKQAEGGKEMEGEVVFGRDSMSNLLKAVSGTEWMYQRGALERGRRANLRQHQFTRYHRRWLADNVHKEEEDSCKLWLLQLSPDVGTVRKREEHGADEGMMSEEVIGSGELLSRVQELDNELKVSERKRMDLIQSNAALQKILKACREQEVRAQQKIASLWERLGGADKDSAPTAPSEGHSKRIPHRWWLKVSAGSYDTSLLPSSPTEQAEGGKEMEGEVVFRSDTKSNLLKAVSGTEWMYQRGALKRGRRSATANLHQHQFTHYHQSWLADNVQKEEEESCKQWLLQSSPDVGSVREEEEQGLMSKVYKQALRDYQEKIAEVLIVKNIISDLEPYLTKVEYLQVESKLGNMAQVDELFRILLTKGNRHFKGFCHVLEDNGYQHWAHQLRSSTDGGETEDNTALLRRKPSWTLLQRSVVPRVSTNWKALGLNLGIKDSCLSAIEKSKPHQPNACCTVMFSMWLGRAPHTGGLPLTWLSVLSAVGKVDSATSEELLAELKSGAKTHPATFKLAGKLEAYYNRLEAVVGDELTPKSEFVELAVVERRKKEGWRKKKFEEFLHATLNGIDEIYEKSYPVEYCQILTLEKGPTTGKHIIVSGAPGSGKTTLVRQLCKDLSSGRLQSGYTLVVLVELRELILLLQDKEEAQLHHFLTKFKHQVDTNQVCRELEESDGRGVLLVLDGFDELDARMRRCQLLKKLLSTESIYLPDCDILVTSRPVTCPDLLGLMQPLHRHIEILGFSEDHIASFIRSYFACTCQPPPSLPTPSQMSAEGGCEAEKLLSRLAQLPQVKTMCRTPVVLKIICVVCQILGSDNFPATMTGIYEAFIHCQLLKNAPQGTEISSLLQVPSSDYPFFSDLGKIAFECCTKQKLTISREDIGSTPPPFTRGSIYGLLFEDRVTDLGALYHFMHKTVQEALAACHLAALPDPKSHEEVWKEWFGRPEMAEVWKFYSAFTGLKRVDISSIVPIVDEAIRTLLVISLFEAGNASLAGEELPHIFPQQLWVHLRTSYETAVYAFALQHHPSLERLVLSCPMRTTGSVNLQLLLDALFHHPTAKEFYIECGYSGAFHEQDRAALCQFLRGKHRLAEVELNEVPVEVVVAALSTESSTMEELELGCGILDDDDATGNLLDCLRSTSLRRITIGGQVRKLLLPILRGLAGNTTTVDRTVECDGDFPLDPPLVSQLAELRQFLVPCVNCDLSTPLPVGVWGTLLSGVGDARQLERLRVGMHGQPEGAGPEWDRIDQPTLEEVEKSWAHSRCGEIEVNISDCSYFQRCTQWFKFPDIIEGSTLDATMELLCAVVRGIIQREDQFVLKLQVKDEQVSRLVELEDIAKIKCAVTRTESEIEAENWMADDFMKYTLTVLELKPLREYL